MPPSRQKRIHQTQQMLINAIVRAHLTYPNNRPTNKLVILTHNP